MAIKVEIPDGAAQWLRCTAADACGFLSVGTLYCVQRHGDYYMIPAHQLGFGYDFFITHFG